MPSTQHAFSLSDVVPQLTGVSLLRSLSEEARRAVATRASIVEVPMGGRVFAMSEAATAEC